MKKLLIVPGLVSVLAGLTCASAGSARADTCLSPPAAAISLSSSRDPVWRAQWCGDQSMVDTLWFGLNLNQSGDDWKGGWGYEDVCNDSLFLSRLFNAGFIVREVEKISTHFHENTTPNKGHAWFNFVHIHEGNGYEPKCCNDNLTKCCLWATHHSCCWDSTDLCLAWGFERGAANRSNTLPHEATHDDVGHVSDDACSNGGSCDTFYSDYNANTMQINYSYDAAAAYLIETVNGKVQRKVTVFDDAGKQMCGYIPLLADSERDSLLADAANRLNMNFESGAVFPLFSDAANVDDVKNTPWECAACKTADYTFSPQTFGDNKACNELTNKGNVAVNKSMRSACTAYNSAITKASGPSAFGKVASDLYSSTTGRCLGCADKDTQAYCNTRKAAASTAGDLDPYGIISSCGYTYEDDCLEQYCHEKFQSAWSSHAGDATWDDPRGCLDAVCGKDKTCRRLYLSYGGDPTYYKATGCLSTLISCYDKHGFTIPGKGVNPSPKEIPECTSAEALCEAIQAIRQKVAGYRMVNRWINPGDPVSHGNPWERTSQETLLAELGQMKTALGRKQLTEAQFEAKLVRLMARPEAQAVFFNLEPRAYVSLFGRAGLDTFAPPAQRTIEPQAIPEKELPARARVLVKQIQKLQAKQIQVKPSQSTPARE